MHMVRQTPVASRDGSRQRVIASLLAQGDAMTFAQIAAATGLAVGTVTSIVREYEAAGVLDLVPGAGRRGATVRIGRGAGVVASIVFGHHHVGVAVADLGGEVLIERLVDADVDAEHESNFAAAVALVDDLLAAVGEPRASLRGVAVGLPAPIAFGRVLGNAIMPGWVGVDVAGLAAASFDCPIVVENDANLAALAEHRRGAARGQSVAVFVKISSGLGAGIILDGRIFGGFSGIAGELGHLTFDEHGPLCRCGSRGCLEAYTSSTAARDLMKPQLPGAEIGDVIDAAKHGNVAAQRVFEDAGLHLGWGLAVVANLLNPGVIVVGGDMARAGDLLLASTRIAMRRHVFAGASATPVVVSELLERAPAVGGVIAAIEASELGTEEAVASLGAAHD